MTDLVKQSAPALKFRLDTPQFFPLDGFLDHFFSVNPLKTSIYKGDISFASDIKASDKEVVLEVELPAIDTETLNIIVDNNKLIITAEKPFDKDENYTYLRQEIKYGKYSREYEVPQMYDLSSITSTYKNGVLTVSIQRKPETQTRKVEVKFT